MQLLISQDMLEGLFGTIRQLGGDSSTQTLKGYGHALNKFQVTARMTAKIKMTAMSPASWKPKMPGRFFAVVTLVGKQIQELDASRSNLPGSAGFPD